MIPTYDEVIENGSYYGRYAVLGQGWSIYRLGEVYYCVNHLTFDVIVVETEEALC